MSTHFTNKDDKLSTKIVKLHFKLLFFCIDSIFYSELYAAPIAGAATYSLISNSSRQAR